MAGRAAYVIGWAIACGSNLSKRTVLSHTWRAAAQIGLVHLCFSGSWGVKVKSVGTVVQYCTLEVSLW